MEDRSNTQGHVHVRVCVCARARVYVCVRVCVYVCVCVCAIHGGQVEYIWLCARVRACARARVYMVHVRACVSVCVLFMEDRSNIYGYVHV